MNDLEQFTNYLKNEFNNSSDIIRKEEIRFVTWYIAEYYKYQADRLDDINYYSED